MGMFFRHLALPFYLLNFNLIGKCLIASFIKLCKLFTCNLKESLCKKTYLLLVTLAGKIDACLLIKKMFFFVEGFGFSLSGM